MRSEEEVRDKLEYLMARRLRQRKEKFLGRQYRNCVYNVRHRMRGNGKCGFCHNDEVLQKIGSQIYVCDDEGTARGCTHFKCRNTVESVEKDFDAVIRSPSRCGNEYPRLAVMIWLLQEGKESIKNNDLFVHDESRAKRFWGELIGFLFLRWW
jgi:hypothetical protein